MELIGVSLLAQSMLLPYIDVIKDFSKEFVHIEKLWYFIDNTPKIVGYDTGKNFDFKKGNFEIKDLNFSYSNSTEVLTNFSLNIKG